MRVSQKLYHLLLRRMWAREHQLDTEHSQQLLEVEQDSEQVLSTHAQLPSFCKLQFNM